MARVPKPACHRAVCTHDWLQPSGIIISLPREDAMLQLSALLQIWKGCNHLRVSSHHLHFQTCDCNHVCFLSHNSKKHQKRNTVYKGVVAFSHFLLCDVPALFPGFSVKPAPPKRNKTQFDIRLGIYPQARRNVCTPPLTIKVLHNQQVVYYTAVKLSYCYCEYFHKTFRVFCSVFNSYAFCFNVILLPWNLIFFSIRFWEKVYQKLIRSWSLLEKTFVLKTNRLVHGWDALINYNFIHPSIQCHY